MTKFERLDGPELASEHSLLITIIFSILGLGQLLPWNCFINSNDYKFKSQICIYTHFSSRCARSKGRKLFVMDVKICGQWKRMESSNTRSSSWDEHLSELLDKCFSFEYDVYKYGFYDIEYGSSAENQPEFEDIPNVDGYVSYFRLHQRSSNYQYIDFRLGFELIATSDLYGSYDRSEYC